MPKMFLFISDAVYDMSSEITVIKNLTSGGGRKQNDQGVHNVLTVV